MRAHRFWKEGLQDLQRGKLDDAAFKTLKNNVNLSI